ncbi:MAG: M20/M25/M40 family metallo-hydrolase [Vulcanimicrobiota bacterium]
MKIASFPLPTPRANLHASPQAAPAAALPEDSFLSSVQEHAQSWGHQGKKLGALGLVAYATSQVPLQVMMRLPDIPIPAAIALSIGTMAAVSVEERYLGIGKKVGQLALGAVGAGVGAARHILGSKAETTPGPVTLAQAPATGAAPREALLPSLLHRAQGGAPARNKVVEIGEGIGATAGTLVCAYGLPNLVTNMFGYDSLVGQVMGSMVGPLAGMVIGGLEENFLGIGRAAGELVGTGLSAAGVKAPVRQPAVKEPGALKKGFLKLNGAIAEPIVGFLVDTTLTTNRLLAEKPVQNIHFNDRPEPKVNRQRLVDNFVSLTGIYGPSGKEQAVTAELTTRMQALGFAVERKEDGTLIGTLPASPGQQDAPTVMLSAHQDTVEPTNPGSIRNDGKRIYTDGRHVLGADDRAGLAEILEGVTSVLEQQLDHPEIKLVFPVDEERGLRGASRLKPEDISTRPTLGFVVDSLSVKDVHLTNDAVIVNPDSIKYQFSQEDPLIQVVFQSMARAGLEPRPIHAPILTGAGSDANTVGFNSGHIRSLAVGAGERDMHTGMEHIYIDDLEQAARHVVGYITNSCDLRVEGDAIVARQAVS